MFKSPKINFIIFLVAGLILVGAFLHPFISEVKAVTNTSIEGYAWSEKIGWIDFSPVNGGVSVDSNGYLTGHAWSENIGWIKFGGLSAPFPVGISTASQNAQIVSTNLIGWARACGGMYDVVLNQTVANNTCGGTSRTDGWDGWISLNGFGSNGSTYGVSFVNNKTFSGYAMGSDVIGWIDFSPVFGGVQLSASVITPITIYNFTATPLSIPKYGSTVISWTSEGANTCNLTKNAGGVITDLGPVATTSGSVSSSNISTTTIFAIQCDNYGNSANATTTVSVIVLPRPDPRLSLLPSQITWDDPTAGDICSLKKGGVEISTAVNGTIIDNDLPAGIVFELTCTNSIGEDPVTVTAVSVPPSIGAICTPSQNYTYRNTRWTMSLSTTSVTVTNTQWVGTDKDSKENQDNFNLTNSRLTLDHLYVTVGTKVMNATTTGMRADGVTPFTSTCSTEAVMKLEPGRNEGI